MTRRIHVMLTLLTASIVLLLILMLVGCTGDGSQQQEARTKSIRPVEVTPDAVEVRVRNADGTRQTQLFEGEVLAWAPVWSPDGKKIAFSLATRQPEIFVVNADGSGLPTKLTNTTVTPVVSAFAPAWSPDGKKIAYVTGVPGSSGDIYMMNPDGSGKYNLTSSNPDQAVHSISNPTWSPDGKKVAFTGIQSVTEQEQSSDSSASPAAYHIDIYLMNPDGSGKTRLTKTQEEEGSAAWSPEGEKLAFPRGSSGHEDLYVMNSDGSELTKPTSTAAGEYGPTWSPDGKKIAFSAWDAGGPGGGIFVVSSVGTHKIHLFKGETSGPIAWSPDGEKIAFSDRAPGGPSSGIFVVNSDGSGLKKLANVATASGPTWSPDGKEIAFMAGGQVYVMNSDGTRLTNLITNSTVE
jgi:TolB protein